MTVKALRVGGKRGTLNNKLSVQRYCNGPKF